MPELSNDKDGEGGAAPPATLLQSLKGLWQELPGLISDRVDLLALELQRAGKALVQIVALVVAATILGVTAWLALWGVVIGLLMALRVHWAAALLLVLLLNIGAAWWAVSRARTLLPALRLPATRRHLTMSPSPQPGANPPAPAPERPPEPIPAYASNASNAAGHAVAP